MDHILSWTWPSWDARLRGIYRGNWKDEKPALLVGISFTFHPGYNRRFKYANVEIDFSTSNCMDAGSGQQYELISYGPKLITGISTTSTHLRSYSWPFKTPEPLALVDANVTYAKETNTTNCMKIKGSSRSDGTRLVWTLKENPTAGFGLQGLPSGLEVAFLIALEEAVTMSVHVREVKVGWGVFDKEGYMSSKYWPVTSFSHGFVLDPDDSRHEAPLDGISECFKAEDVCKIFKKHGDSLIPN